MTSRHPALVLLVATAAAVAGLAPGCHRARPQGPGSAPVEAAAAAPQPSPLAAATPGPAVDPVPFEDWYRQNRSRIALNQSAPPEDLSFAIALLDWIVKGDDAAWGRMEGRVQAAYDSPGRPLAVAILPTSIDEARSLHALAAPLVDRPQAERDGAAEERTYKKALLLNPADPDLYTHLAIARSLGKDYVAAERWAKLAIAIDPSFLSAYQELAYAYKNLARYEDAIRVAERGLNVDGELHTKALLLARQGQSYWLLGQQEKALSAFRTAKRLGGPAWVDSYLEGKQELAQPFRE